MELRRVYPKRVGVTPLTGSSTLLFTADQRYAIERLMIANITASDATATIYVVPTGSSASDSVAIMKGFNIPANDLALIVAPIILEVGDKIYGFSGTASALNLWFHVNEVETQTQ